MTSRDVPVLSAAVAPLLLLAVVATLLGHRTAGLFLFGTALAAGMAGTLLIVALRLYRNVLGRIADQETVRARELLNLYRQLEARDTLVARLGTKEPLPPLRGWAISPDAALVLTRLVQERRPRLVLELGSGASTVVLAICLKAAGAGSLVSLEHDREHADRTREELRSRALSEVAEVRTAPLRPVSVGGRTGDWYDPAAVEDLDEIDLLLVDGPPDRPGELARFPALPLLWPRLAERAAIFVDDAGREDDAETIRLWRDSFEHLGREEHDCEKGAVVLYRTPPPARA